MTCVGKEQVIHLLSGVVAIEGYFICNLNVQLTCNFPLATALLIGNVSTNR